MSGFRRLAGELHSLADKSRGEILGDFAIEYIDATETPLRQGSAGGRDIAIAFQQGANDFNDRSRRVAAEFVN